MASAPETRAHRKAATRPAGEGVLHALPLPLLNDAALALRAAEGHPSAARAVWDRFSRLVRGLLRRSLGPTGDLEDHLQETFLRFFRLVAELRDPSALSSFLVGITMRVAREELRRRRVRRWLRLGETETAPEPEAPSADYPARDALRRLYVMLDRLDDDARLVFVLRYMERLELVEVASALGCSLATAKRRIARATARINAMVGSEPALAEYVGSGWPRAAAATEVSGISRVADAKGCPRASTGAEEVDDV